MLHIHRSRRPGPRLGVVRFFSPSITLAGLVVFLLAASPSQAVTSVSVGPGCDYETIQAAVDAMTAVGASDPADAVVRIQRGSFSALAHQLSQSIVIDGGTLTLEGGLVSCTNDGANSIRTFLGGTGSDSVLTITGDSDVVLRRLQIEGGGGTSGGGVAVEGSRALFEDLLVRRNDLDGAGRGGGLAVTDGSAVMLRDVEITDNEAGAGGGIWCDHSTLRGHDGNRITDNRAHTGGGVDTRFCTMEFVDSLSVKDNEAFQGGGFHLASGDLTLRSTAFGFVVISDNEANTEIADGISGASGGGFHLSEGSALLVDVTVDRNQAIDDGDLSLGGGFTVMNADLRVTTAGVGCPGYCSILRGNRSEVGALVHDAGGSRVEILGTRISGHGHPDFRTRSSSLIDSRFTRASTHHIEGSTIFRNQVVSIAELANHGGDIQVVDSTITDNDSLRTIFVTGTGNHAPSAGLYGSIVWEPAGTTVFDIGRDATARAECVLSSDAGSEPEDVTTWKVVDPLFADPSREDFHLTADSPAIDACRQSATIYVPRITGADQDGEERCVANLGVETKCDIGSDEVRSHPAGLLFADGFESGGVANWTSEPNQTSDP